MFPCCIYGLGACSLGEFTGTSAISLNNSKSIVRSFDVILLGSVTINSMQFIEFNGHIKNLLTDPL